MGLGGHPPALRSADGAAGPPATVGRQVPAPLGGGGRGPGGGGAAKDWGGSAFVVVVVVVVVAQDAHDGMVPLPLHPPDLAAPFLLLRRLWARRGRRDGRRSSRRRGGAGVPAAAPRGR